MRPVFRKFGTLIDILGGRDPIYDEATGKTLPAIPALPLALAQIRGDLNEQREAITDLTSVVQQVADQQNQLAVHEGRLNEHDAAIAALIASTFESGAERALKAEELRKADTVEGEVEGQ